MIKREELENAIPGTQVTIKQGRLKGTWVRIEDADPPYVYNMWVEISTGKVLYHWSSLLAELENEQ